MENLIGKILKGTIAGMVATFEVVKIKSILGEDVLILECVEYGAPLIRLNASEINNPVRA